MDSGIIDFIQKLELAPQPILNMNFLGDQTFALEIKREHDFIPGQVVGLSLDHKIPPRLYSISSSPHQENLELIFKIKPGGLLSDQLSKKQVGAQVLVSKPFGAFLGDDQAAWWIGAGTGLAPFLSMMRFGWASNKLLIHGSRKLEGFYYRSEIERIMGERYLKCCTTEADAGVYSGRLTTYLKDLEEMPEGINYYLCGSPEMVVDVRDVLLSKGVDFHQIMSEIYF